MNLTLYHSSTARYYKDYIYNVEGTHRLKIKGLQVPFEYKAYLQEGKTNSNCRTISDYVTLLILKYCNEDTSSNLLNDLLAYLESLNAIYKYRAEGGSYEGAYEPLVVDIIDIPVDLFELIIEVKPHHKETSLKTMVSEIVPKYVLAILNHYHRRFMQGETI